MNMALVRYGILIPVATKGVMKCVCLNLASAETLSVAVVSPNGMMVRVMMSGKLFRRWMTMSDSAEWLRSQATTLMKILDTDAYHRLLAIADEIDQLREKHELRKEDRKEDL